MSFKYREDKFLEELDHYIQHTYSEHYSTDKLQTLDVIDACGDAKAFCRSNILKYASRYDKKGSARQDLLKVLHYGILLKHFHTRDEANYAAVIEAAQED